MTSHKRLETVLRDHAMIPSSLEVYLTGEGKFMLQLILQGKPSVIADAGTIAACLDMIEARLASIVQVK